MGENKLEISLSNLSTLTISRLYTRILLNFLNHTILYETH